MVWGWSSKSRPWLELTGHLYITQAVLECWILVAKPYALTVKAFIVSGVAAKVPFSGLKRSRPGIVGSTKTPTITSGPHTQ